MNSLRRLTRDRVGAALLILLGVGIVAEGLTLRIGTAVHMGPGFMPVVYGLLIALIGVAIGLAAGPKDFGDETTNPVAWRGWLCILGGVVAFVVVGVYGGLAPATFAAVFLSALGDRSNSVRDAAMLAAAMVVLAVLLFSYGLKLQLPLFAWG